MTAEQTADTQLALLSQEIRYLRQELTTLKDDTHDELMSMKSDISSIKAMADRWRGATVLLLSLGSIVGAALSWWSSFTKVMR